MIPSQQNLISTLQAPQETLLRTCHAPSVALLNVLNARQVQLRALQEQHTAFARLLRARIRKTQLARKRVISTLKLLGQFRVPPHAIQVTPF